MPATTLSVSNLVSAAAAASRHHEHPTPPRPAAGIGWLVALEGVWIGFDHDPDTKGTGEFFWVSVASDGDHLFTCTSADYLPAESGVQTGVEEGTWLGFDRAPLFYTRGEPPYDHIAVGFNLLERDNSAVADEILGLFRDPAKILANLFLPGSGSIAAAVVSAAQVLVRLDKNDQSIAANRTLLKVTGGLRYGFFALAHQATGRRPNVALFSVLPVGAVGDDRFWYAPDDGHRTLNLKGAVSIGAPGAGRTLELPAVRRDGRLSFMAKVQPPALTAGIWLFLKDAAGNVLWRERWNPVESGAWCREACSVAPGTYTLEVAVDPTSNPLATLSNVKVDVGVIFSAD